MSQEGDRFHEDAASNQFLDRSKVRILLCENDSKSCQEVADLLCKCSYQVTAVKTPRQVIDALNAQGEDIDIILSEVDLPVAKGFKMLKYIMREKELRRIPIIMMSAKDEVSVVVKCLRLGAADYLVKPLRTNELLNLWTHMWRRRKMVLGVAEKNILNHELDMPASDPSDTNTNSTTPFSDDTDDKKCRRSTMPEVSTSIPNECESHAFAAGEPQVELPTEYEPRVSRATSLPGILSCPRRSELKVGESSAFFTYIRSNAAGISTSDFRCSSTGAAAAGLHHGEQCPVANQSLDDPEAQIPRESSRAVCTIRTDADTSIADMALGMSRPSGLQRLRLSGEEEPGMQLPSTSHSKTTSFDSSQDWFLPNEQGSGTGLHPSNPGNVGDTVSQAVARSPLYMPQMLKTVVGPPAAHIFQGSLQEGPSHVPSNLLTCYNGLPQCQAVSLMAPFSYYPLGIGMHAAQMQTLHTWLPAANSSVTEMKTACLARREAALVKFRNKRKERCFDKKIRYVNRKRLAENRPRVRGQFVRQAFDAETRSNGQTVTNNDSDLDEDEDEDGPVSSELGADSAPECESEF
ncbi:Two-component response regulator-like [Nymphaea thermarum]|nr:Two-component response regulator-like [Nymphaea thermarum]